MIQMLLEAENKLVLEPFAQMARKQGVSVRYIVQKEKKTKLLRNPSPSGDVWFDDPQNLTEIKEGLKSSIEDGFVTEESSPIIRELFAKYGKRKKEYV